MDKESWGKAAVFGVMAAGTVAAVVKRQRRWLAGQREIIEQQVRRQSVLDLKTDKSIETDKNCGLLVPQVLHRASKTKHISPILGIGNKTADFTGRGLLPESVFSLANGYINANSALSSDYLKGNSAYFLKAAPSKEVVFDPQEVRAAIVTCGGLCPGLNVVVRELVMTLWQNYGSQHVFGVHNGYRGFYTPGKIRPLSPDCVKNIHTQGGTVLSTSRGGWDQDRVLEAIVENKFNQVYIIGGDGTHRGIAAITKEIKRRGLEVAVIGVPKTIDNDIPIIDRSFGFDTSVEEAQRAIESAYVEASSVEYGVGLVNLMGRESGFIALHSSLSSRSVNLCLIPESEYELKGPKGVLSYILHHLKTKGSMVIVVAEGAAAGCVEEKLRPWTRAEDAFGQKQLFAIGQYLRGRILEACKEAGIDCTLKYVDPTYMVRSTAANAADRALCTMLAQAAVHGAFAGFTGFSVGSVAGQIALIPVELMTQTCEGTGAPPGQRRVDVKNNLMWWRLVASTGQPSFRNMKDSEN
jgi:6-phosphofructokinase 1